VQTDGSKDERVGKSCGLSVERKTRSLIVAAGLIIVCATLAGCSIPVADLPGIGVPGSAPARSENPPSYLPVHDVPPPRDEAVLSPDEQKKIQTDLLNARDKQAAQANALVKSAGTTPSSTR